MAQAAGDRRNFIPTVVTSISGVQQTELDFLRAAYINIDYRNISSTKYTVTSVTAYQLDLISYDCYGDESYWWIIAQFNRIFDPVNDVIPGMELNIPSPSQVMQILQQRVNDKNQTKTGSFVTI